MGAWGADSFENDDASDWLADFCDAPNEKIVSDALSSVTAINADEYLEAPDCSVGIAAAEVVAALNDAPNSNLPDDAKECVSKLRVDADSSLILLALKAVERIKTDSELKELWDESENPDEWYFAVSNLELRLKR